MAVILHLNRHNKADTQTLLRQARQNYLDNLDNLSEAAISEMDEAADEGANRYWAMTQAVKDIAPAAGKIAADYYATVRQIWQQQTGRQLTAYQIPDDMRWERILWKLVGGFNNTDHPGYTYKEVMSGHADGLSIDDLWPELKTADDMEQFIGDFMTMGARLATQTMLERDPTEPRWARIPRGTKTCAFCMMLASRGYVYRSEESAGGLGNYYHPHDECIVVPSWGASTYTDYDNKAYLNIYETALKEAGGPDVLKHKNGYRQVLAQMRADAPTLVKEGIHLPASN